MEEELLAAGGEYAVGDVYRSWGMIWSWVIWRQFLLNAITDWLAVYALTFIIIVSWPTPWLIGLFVGFVYFLVPLSVVATLIFIFGRKTTVLHGLCISALCAALSTLTGIKWIVLPLHILVTCGVAPMAITFCHDEWYDGGWGSWGFIVLVKCLVMWRAMTDAFPASDLEWHANAGVVLVGSGIAFVLALLIHFFMLESPLEILRRFYADASSLDPVNRLREEESAQEAAVEALRRFAKAAGKSVPEKLKTLKPEKRESTIN